MILSDIAENYKKVFILCMEAAGNDTGNAAYLGCEDIINNSKVYIQKAIDDGVDFKIYVSILITTVLSEIHGFDKLENNDPSVNGQLLEDLFQRYLWKATRTFSVRNGLPVLNKLELEFKLIVLKDGNKEL